MQIIKTFDYFCLFSDLKLNKAKCEITVTGVLKGVKLTLCGIKILGICYSYYKKLENEN